MWFGHVLRHESLLHDIIEGRMRGRLHEVEKNAPAERPDERKYVALKSTAEGRREWQRLLIAGSHTPASSQIN